MLDRANMRRLRLQPPAAVDQLPPRHRAAPFIGVGHCAAWEKALDLPARTQATEPGEDVASADALAENKEPEPNLSWRTAKDEGWE